MEMKRMANLLQLVPEYRERVWGGRRLRAEGPPIGEAWLVYEQNRIAGGPWAGHTLAEAAEAEGEALLGRAAVARTGKRFPLLIKLLDCADWLSVQVHPNDEQAVRLHGSGHFGKTEAWHLLRVEPGARLIAGLKPGAAPEAVAAAIRDGSILDWVQYRAVQTGETVFVPAGALHALGPGLFLYEIQQTSDITYRVFDWDRPAGEGRKLHIEESVIAVDPRLSGDVTPAPRLEADDRQPLLSCDYFTLEVVTGASEPWVGDPGGQSFHILTAVEGQAEVACGAESVSLRPYESVVVAASAGEYSVQPRGAYRMLWARV
jgi:mannose-6-phosphate isomerase